MNARKWLQGLLFLCLATGVGMSCRKDGGAHNSTAITGGTDDSALLSAVIAGVSWQTDSVTAVLEQEYPGPEKVLTIKGYGSGKLLSFSLRDTSLFTSNDSTLLARQYTVGSWDTEAEFGYFSGKVLLGRDSVWRQEGAAEKGSIQLVSSDGVNKRLSGTFSFTARVFTIDSLSLNFDTVNVSNGVFREIPYVYRPH